jgi:hypothetical protein
LRGRAGSDDAVNRSGSFPDTSHTLDGVGNGFKNNGVMANGEQIPPARSATDQGRGPQTIARGQAACKHRAGVKLALRRDVAEVWVDRLGPVSVGYRLCA